MSELDTIQFTNPSKEDFTHNFNGEPYTVKAGETKSFAQFVAFHLAKHLSTKWIIEIEKIKMTPKQRENRSDPIHSKISQLTIYDTPERRIALYKILKNRNYVEKVISIYPFKGFIGDIRVYENYVKSEEEKELNISQAT